MSVVRDTSIPWASSWTGGSNLSLTDSMARTQLLQGKEAVEVQGMSDLLSSSVSVWNILSTTVSMCRPLTANTLDLGMSDTIV